MPKADWLTNQMQQAGINTNPAISQQSAPVGQAVPTSRRNIGGWANYNPSFNPGEGTATPTPYVANDPNKWKEWANQQYAAGKGTMGQWPSGWVNIDNSGLYDYIKQGYGINYADPNTWKPGAGGGLIGTNNPTVAFMKAMEDYYGGDVPWDVKLQWIKDFQGPAQQGWNTWVGEQQAKAAGQPVTGNVYGGHAPAAASSASHSAPWGGMPSPGASYGAEGQGMQPPTTGASGAGVGYWTPEKMAGAQPMGMGAYVGQAAGTVPTGGYQPSSAGTPSGYQPYTPQSGYYGSNFDPSGDPNIAIGDWLAKHMGELSVPYTWTLPDTAGSLNTMTGLQNQALGKYGDVMNADPYAGVQEIADILYGQSSKALTEDVTDLWYQLNEQMFGKGMGESSVMQENTELLADDFMDAMAKAKQDAYLAALGENKAQQNQQLQAATAATNAANAGLGLQANVGLTNTGRWQQAAQNAVGLSMNEYLTRMARNQQWEEFVKQLDQQKYLQEKGFDLTEEQMNMAGLGGLGQLIAALFGGTGGAAWDALIKKLLEQFAGVTA